MAIILEGTGVGSQDPTLEQIKDIPQGEVYFFVHKWKYGRDGNFFYNWDFPWHYQAYRNNGNPRWDKIHSVGYVARSRKAAIKASLKAARQVAREHAELGI